MGRILKYFTLYDKILIILIVSISLVFIFIPWLDNFNIFSKSSSSNLKSNQVVMIQYDDKIIKRIDLKNLSEKDPVLIEVEGDIGVSKIEIHQGQVRIKKAPKKDRLKVCEKTGWIDNPGPSIICVPNQITVWIEKKEGSNNKEVDGVSW